MSVGRKKLIVIGGGAAGFFGAINAAEKNPNLDVTILEGSRRLLTKVKISGGGRCNVTHSCFNPRDLVKNYPRGEKELLGPFSRFQPEDTIAWYESRGVKLKTEQDGRMFPTTDNSDTIVKCLLSAAQKNDIQIKKGMLVKSVVFKDNHQFLVQTRDGEFIGDYLLLATGSSPIGYAIAKKLGHEIIEPVPSLFTFQIKSPLIDELMGLSFPEAELSMVPHHADPQPKKKFKPFSFKGPVLITHWGLSGPAVLKLSAWGARELAASNYKASLTINWVNISNKIIFEKILERKNNLPKQSPRTRTLDPLPKRFWLRLLDVVGVDESSCWSDMSHQKIQDLSNLITHTNLDIQGKGEFKEEFVTCGGVNLKEVDFRSMASKINPNLYFAGEILNTDGITGGFNFQNAWTTSYIAAVHLSTLQK
ncbi:MAG: aminoacetone oxidase family FAD-binding enzyme [Zetaproteobacteria bacterium]|nr:aminoacetone oxidase family FAD-binding enzyme [Pseudobdellovibrionaceae bacterium]